METSNRLGAPYIERVEHASKLQALKRQEEMRGLVLEGGRMAFEIPVTPEIAAQLAAMPPEPPPAPTGAAMPPMTGQVM